MPDSSISARGAILVSDLIAERHAKELAAIAPERSIVSLTPEGLRGPIEEIEIAFFSGDCFPDRAAPFMGAAYAAKQLRWLHSFSAGVDSPAFTNLVRRGIRVSHSSGANAVAVAHCAMSGLMALSRELPTRLEDQRAHQWERRLSRDLEGNTLAVLGLGPIGLEVGRIGEALRMKVIGLRRRARGDEPFETWGFDRLDDLLRIADYIVLALPLTPETHHLFDDARLDKLKPEAAIINVGRGELFDESALIRALTSGKVRAAALDVFEEEPLPESSPLWDLPNVIVTPHCGGYTEASHRHAVDHFFENLAKYEAGEDLHNEMPPTAK